jgi:putative ABC transport system ATP-binding protein
MPDLIAGWLKGVRAALYGIDTRRMFCHDARSPSIRHKTLPQDSTGPYNPPMSWWKRRDRAQPADIADRALPLVRLENITKIFKTDDGDEETRALSEVTVDIDRGEYVSISGPSGCGKSTFLSVLALLETPTAGRYWLNGRATDAFTPTDRARARSLDVGLIFQSFNLIGDMTVYENVEYPLTLRGGLSPAERQARVMAALDRVGMVPRARQRPGQLSGGHQQLVAVARAIAGRPPILLADEPTGNLDSKSGEALMQILSELHAEGATVCLATHNPNYIARAERHIYLFDGRIEPHPRA